MSTIDVRADRDARTPSAGRTTGARTGSWAGSWRVALRLARRDARRHPGRSLLVLTMIALPVMVMTGLLTGLATKTVSPAEGIPGEMGSAQAVVSSITGAVLRQDPVTGAIGDPSSETPRAAAPLPGAPVPSDPAAPANPSVTTSSLARYLRARIVPVQTTRSVSTVDRSRRVVNELHVDAADPAVRGMIDLRSGRWAQRPGEVVVTTTGIARGLPESGTLRVRPDGASRGTPDTELTIVGVAEPASSLVVDTVRPAPPTTQRARLLVVRDAPITWADIKDANAHGLALTSREVLRHPPSTAEIEAYLRDSSVPRAIAREMVPPLYLTLLTVGLFILSALLAGPAFAVIAQRQRRTLAMAAANGATPAQLRRAVLSQAIVLGAVSAPAATALGVALSPLAIGLVRRWTPDARWGPLDVPWATLALITLGAVVAAMVAATLPARGLGRLDVVSTLRGDTAPRPARRRLPLIGLVVAGIGVAGTWFSIVRSHQTGSSDAMTVLLAASCLTLVAGALLMVPMIIVGVSRLLRRAPVPVRIAARDTARNRGRATPTVAAVMGGAIVLSGLSIVATTLETADARSYRPIGPVGVARVTLSTAPETAGLWAKAAAVVPGGRHVLLEELSPTAAGDQFVELVAAPAGCDLAWLYRGASEIGCPTVGTRGLRSTLLVVDPDEAAAFFGLPADAVEALRRGEAVTGDRDTPTGTLALTHVLHENGDQPTLRPAGQLVVRRVTTGDLGAYTVKAYSSGGPTLVTRETAARLAGPYRLDRGTRYGYVRATGRSVTDTERDIMGGIIDPINPPETTAQVERGYVSPYRGVVWGLYLMTALVILIATVTATALSVGEARRDLTVLAAVGARPRTRTALVAAQAGVLAVVGTLVGLVVGGIPGAMLAHVATTRGEPSMWSSDLVIPWATLGSAVVVIPLLAAAVAALLVRADVAPSRRRA